ncbi:MAG TPA: DNA alkylation repair protein [Anaerolineales bacterium]|nr:DNA alkylation repair protein [Anaerolineales bacterium]
MHPYVRSIKTLFEANANPVNAAPMKKYMRDQFEYLGIKSPQVKSLFSGYVKQNGLPPIEDLSVIVSELWNLPQREFQYLAINLLDKMEKKLPEDFIATLEHLITHKSWWDTVDLIAGHSVGVMFKRYPKVKAQYLKKWRKSENIWLRRTTLLFQLGYKKETDFGLMCELIQENLGSDEFFINKAIGWALRQYAWTNPSAVKKFVKATKELSPLSRKEALKNIGA